MGLVQPAGDQPKANPIHHQNLHAVGPLVGKQVGRVRAGSAEDLDHTRQGRIGPAHVQHAAMLDKVKASDKGHFTAEKANGEIVVTDIQPAK